MTQLPASVLAGVQSAFESVHGRRLAVKAVRPLTGGCINPSARVDTVEGAYFVKWNAGAPPAMFEAEADGLSALRNAATPAGIRVPEVIGCHRAAGGEPSWLLLEFIERGRATADFAKRLGHGIARLHAAAPAPGGFGWTRDNFIGSLEQPNPRLGSWAAFWRNARLAPQVELARSRGHLHGEAGRTLDHLLERTAEALGGPSADDASLLHGDLWSGNVYPGPGGEPVLIDPAVYIGDSEVDLAMSELFGGFPSGFFDAYDEVRAIIPEHDRLRRPLYQLYYLLVHVNLFGGSYVAPSVSAAKAVLAEL